MAVVQTVSLSGNAFSVKNARGKFQSPNGSTVLVGQSVKSGSGAAKPITLCGEPLPSGPWQVAQLFLKMYSPSASGGRALASDVGGVVASCAAWSVMAPATPA